MTDIVENLEAEARQLVELVRKHFSKDTALPGSKSEPPSSGHCAAAAIVLHFVLGGDLVSAKVGGESHWYNRFHTDQEPIEVDATADQFDRDAEWISRGLARYAGTRVRQLREANEETLARARLLAQRAGLNTVADTISDELRSRELA